MYNLKELMDSIICSAKELNIALDESEIIQSHLRVIDHVTKEQEKSILQNGLQSCEPIAFENSTDELNAIKSSFLDFYCPDDNRSTRLTKKYAGFIVLNYSEKVEEAIGSYNNAKSLFKDAVQALGNRDIKFEVIHQLFPLLSTSTSYRKLITLSEIDSIYFNWSSRVRSEKISYEDAKSKLERLLYNTNKALYPDVYESIQLEELELTKHKNVELRIKRPIRVRPECSIRQNGVLTGTTPGLPLILFQNKKVHYTPLSNFDSNTRKLKKSSVANECISKHISLYIKS